MANSYIDIKELYSLAAPLAPAHGSLVGNHWHTEFSFVKEIFCFHTFLFGKRMKKIEYDM